MSRKSSELLRKLADVYFKPKDFEREGEIYKNLGIRKFKKFLFNGYYMNRLIRKFYPGHRLIYNDKHSMMIWETFTRIYEGMHVLGSVPFYISMKNSIENRDYSAEISGDGRPDRKISITGKGIGGLLSSFKMMLDQAVFQGQNSAKNLAQALKYTIATSQEEGAAVGSTILRPIYKSFMDLALKIGENDQTGNNAGVGVISIIDKFVDLERGISDDFVIKYPISLSLYKRGENSVWELWNGLAQPPVNEMFGYWDYYSSVADEGGFVIVF